MYHGSYLVLSEFLLFVRFPMYDDGHIYTFTRSSSGCAPSIGLDAQLVLCDSGHSSVHTRASRPTRSSYVLRESLCSISRPLCRRSQEYIGKELFARLVYGFDSSALTDTACVRRPNSKEGDR